ncbi:hypothetical protein [Gluconacetobacter takamatsuzukensis]|nr:hypothetical protein [Gluconacetobacter takamatsuzukensis]
MGATPTSTPGGLAWRQLMPADGLLDGQDSDAPAAANAGFLDG